MKHLLFAAAIAVALAACSSKPKSESGIVFDDGKTYEEVIAEPYTACLLYTSPSPRDRG